MTRLFFFCAVLLFCARTLPAQDAAASSSASVVPHVLRYAGSLPNAPSGASMVEVTFAIFDQQAGGEPLWKETQQVPLDSAGDYSAILGSTSAGLPQELFANGQARWLSATLSGAVEAPRTLLAATPYSLKSADAETLGGHPASDFLPAHGGESATPNALTSVTTVKGGNGVLVNNTVNGSGTGPTVTLGLDSSYLSTLGNGLYALKTDVVSTLTGVSGVVVTHNGAAYSATLDGDYLTTLGNGVYSQIAAANTYKAAQTMASISPATASTGYNSHALNFTASAYNSASSSAEAINFSWQAEPGGNKTASPYGTMNLLTSTGSKALAETGLKISNTGNITFASGQTFPGAGTGTITGITAGTDLTGGGTAGNVTLNLNAAALQSANDGRYARLAAANTFAGANNFDGPLAVNAQSTQTVSAGNGFASSVTNNGALGGGLLSQAASTGGRFVASGAGGQGAVGIVSADGTTNGGAGVQGYTGSISAEGSSTLGNFIGVGVFADTANMSPALLATAEVGEAVTGYSAASFPTAYFENDSTATGHNASVLNATGGSGNCIVWVNGDLQCSGAVTMVVPVAGSREVKTYSMQTAERWFEDAGEGRLVGGVAHVSFDPTVAEIVDPAADYRVFLTPGGDCKGLYVSHKTKDGFDVRELGGGSSSVAFDYRIMMQQRGRAGVADARLEDVSAESKARPAVRRIDAAR